MRAVQRTLLHFAVFTALVFSLYPLLAMVFHYSRLSAGSVWLAQLFLLLVSFAALTHAIFIRRQYRKKPVLVNLSFFGIGLLSGAAAWVLSPFPGVFMAVISAIAVFAVYQAGARLFFIEYDSLIHPYVYTAICMLYIVPSAIIWFGDHDASFLWQAVLFLIISCIFAVAHNFSGIDIALQSQGAEEEHLPKGLLRHNRLLLCAFGAAVGLLLLMRSVIGTFLWTLLKTVLHYAGRIFLWIAGLFTGNEKEAAELEESESSFLQQTAVTRNEWVTLICTLILAAIAVFVIIRYRRRITEGIRNFFRSIRSWLAWLFGRSYDTPFRMEAGGYTDYHMDLTAEESDFADLPSPEKVHYRRLYRKYRRMEHTAEKYRLGYSLLLYRLSQDGLSVKPSLSPQEVLALVQAEGETFALWKTVTYGYEQARYREQLPDGPAFSALDSLLSEKL
ncbi:MAG: hypothetical protein IJ512_00425 [Ruminococcus sp.]|nr:hypothetical protein [Ruminococcus sp.]